MDFHLQPKMRQVFHKSTNGGMDIRMEQDNVPQYDGSIKWISMRVVFFSLSPSLSLAQLHFHFINRHHLQLQLHLHSKLITNLRAFMPTNCHVFSQVTAQLSRALSLDLECVATSSDTDG